MSYDCKILADSISPGPWNDRLVTFQITFPRFILAEVNTHRMLSRNSASSRAIPVSKAIQMVGEDPFIPEQFGANIPGMRWENELEEEEAALARLHWSDACHMAIHKAEALDGLGVHKALANRILEPFKWHTAIVTGTDWQNFFALRLDKNAQQEFRIIAKMMQATMAESVPRELGEGRWHLPLVNGEETGQIGHGTQAHDAWEYWRKVSAGRCARVSYLTHDGKRDPEKDIELADRLISSGHMSPMEHQATPFSKSDRDLQLRVIGLLKQEQWVALSVTVEQVDRIARAIRYDQNLCGWHSYRSLLPNQDNFQKVLDAVAL